MKGDFNVIGGILFTLGVTVFCSGVYKIGHFNGYWKREKELFPEEETK